MRGTSGHNSYSSSHEGSSVRTVIPCSIATSASLPAEPDLPLHVSADAFSPAHESRDLTSSVIPISPRCSSEIDSTLELKQSTTVPNHATIISPGTPNDAFLHHISAKLSEGDDVGSCQNVHPENRCLPSCVEVADDEDPHKYTKISNDQAVQSKSDLDLDLPTVLGGDRTIEMCKDHYLKPDKWDSGKTSQLYSF